MRDGETVVYTFIEATDTIQVYNNVPTLCGPRKYTICNSDGSAIANNWVSVSA